MSDAGLDIAFYRLSQWRWCGSDSIIVLSELDIRGIEEYELTKIHQKARGSVYRMRDGERARHTAGLGLPPEYNCSLHLCIASMSGHPVRDQLLLNVLVLKAYKVSDTYFEIVTKNCL